MSKCPCMDWNKKTHKLWSFVSKCPCMDCSFLQNTTSVAIFWYSWYFCGYFVYLQPHKTDSHTGKKTPKFMDKSIHKTSFCGSGHTDAATQNPIATQGKGTQICGSVRPSVRLSVTPFWLCSHHRIIMKFSGVITSDKSDVHAKGHGQRSKVKVTEVTTQLNRFRTVTQVWIHIWWWNDACSLTMLRRGALLFLKVIRQISRSHGSKNRRIWPKLGFSGL